MRYRDTITITLLQHGTLSYSALKRAVKADADRRQAWNADAFLGALDDLLTTKTVVCIETAGGQFWALGTR